MKNSYEEDRSTFQYMDPNLIFKIELITDVHDDTFRSDLKRVGINTISSAPNKSGYWVVFADDANLTKFRHRLEKYRSDEKPSFIDQIKAVREISPEEKMDESLLDQPIPIGKREYVDVEVWRMEDNRLEKFTAGMRSMIKEQGDDVTDEMTTKGFYVARAYCGGQSIKALARLREVAHIDRPIRIGSKAQRAHDGEDIEVTGSPEPGAPGILVVDSGVNDHPLLKDSIKGRRAHPSDDGGVVAGHDTDDAGHGTSVAGVALYGDVERCLAEKQFNPRIWIYSAKIMYEKDGEPIFDEKSLVEHQLKDAVEHASNVYNNCKIINISFGNTKYIMDNGKRQFRIASLIDELSVKHPRLLFIIAAGNLDGYDTYDYSHPDYFANPPRRFKIIDPATSAHGITVGSIEAVQKNTPIRPSWFTRVGPGLRDMIKPELVENGGDGNGNDVLVLNPQWHRDGNRFTRKMGTSFSAPAVSHMLAILVRAFPNASRNLLKALALSSASLPAQRPGMLGELDERGKSHDIKTLLNVYGYGKPNLDYALYSDSDRVVLVYDGAIGLQRVDFFPLIFPDEFFKKKGIRSIEINLAYDPPTNRSRQDYMGVIIEHALYKNVPLDTIRDAYDDASSGAGGEESLGMRLKNRQIKLVPGSRIRKTTAHQKSSVVYRVSPRIDIQHPLVVAVSCQKRWYRDVNYRQKYALVVTARHGGGIDLYNGIKESIPERSEVEKLTV